MEKEFLEMTSSGSFTAPPSTESSATSSVSTFTSPFQSGHLGADEPFTRTESESLSSSASSSSSVICLATSKETTTEAAIPVDVCHVLPYKANPQVEIATHTPVVSPSSSMRVDDDDDNENDDDESEPRVVPAPRPRPQSHRVPTLDEAVAAGCANRVPGDTARYAARKAAADTPAWRRGFTAVYGAACYTLASVSVIVFGVLLYLSPREVLAPENSKSILVCLLATCYLLHGIVRWIWRSLCGRDGHAPAAAVGDTAQPYDLVFCIDGFRRFAERGWAVRVPTFNPAIARSVLRCADHRQRRRADGLTDGSSGVTREPSNGRSRRRRRSDDASNGAGINHGDVDGGHGSDERLRKAKVVAFAGKFGAGKTYTLNELYRTDFPSGSLKHTKGVSFKWLENSQMVLVDTNGALMPVTVGEDDALTDRNVTEMFINDFVLALADYVVYVVNELTSNDQEYIDALAHKLSQNKRTHLFVLHNYHTTSEVDEVRKLWERRVETPYRLVGHVEYAENTEDGRASTHEADRLFITNLHGVTVCHMRIAREGSPAGKLLNARTYVNLRTRIQALASLRDFDPCAIFDAYARSTFPNYVDGPLNLDWHAVGAYAGDDVSGAPSDVVCRFSHTSAPSTKSKHQKHAHTAPHLGSGGGGGSGGGIGHDARTGTQKSLHPASGLSLRLSTVYDHLGIGVNVTVPDFDAPVDIIDSGNRMVVQADVPGVAEVTVNVCTPPNDGTQYVEVKGRRECDYHHGLDHYTTTRPSRSPRGSRRGGASAADYDDSRSDDDQEEQVERQSSMSLLSPSASSCSLASMSQSMTVYPTATSYMDRDYIAKRTAQLVRPTPPQRRFGNMYFRVNMPPGSHLVRESITIKNGVLRLIIVRGSDTQNVRVSVNDSA